MIMGRKLHPLTEHVNRRVQEEVNIKNPIPLPTRNGVHFIQAKSHLPMRMMESPWFIGIVSN